MDDLSALAAKYQTDKGPGDVPGKYHFYTETYDQLLRDRRDDVRRVLEVGVLWGSSLCMWRDYFPAAEVIGVDVEPRTSLPGEPRIQIITADARETGVQLRLITEGPYDLVVDDASHDYGLQRALALALLPHADAYIVEDVPDDNVHLLIDDLAGLANQSGFDKAYPVKSRIPNHTALVYIRPAWTRNG